MCCPQTESKKPRSGWAVSTPRTGRVTSISTQIVWPICTSYENSRGEMPSLSLCTLSMDTTHIPTSLQEWRGALQLQKKLMGLAPSRLRHVIDIFLDVNEI